MKNNDRQSWLKFNEVSKASLATSQLFERSGCENIWGSGIARMAGIPVKKGQKNITYQCTWENQFHKEQGSAHHMQLEHLK